MYLPIIFEIKCNSDYVVLTVNYWYNFHLDNYKRQRSTMSPSTDWLSYLRTQLKAFVDRVCLQIRVFLALFSQIHFFTWSCRHFKVLQLKGNFYICTQIWTVHVACLTNQQQKMSAIVYYFQNLYSRPIFVWSLQLFLILFQKCFVTFCCNWIWQMQTPFLQFWSTWNWRNSSIGEKFALTRSFIKVIRVLTFSGREKFDNWFYFKILGWYSLIAQYYKLK